MDRINDIEVTHELAAALARELRASEQLDDVLIQHVEQRFHSEPAQARRVIQAYLNGCHAGSGENECPDYTGVYPEIFFASYKLTRESAAQPQHQDAAHVTDNEKNKTRIEINIDSVRAYTDTGFYTSCVILGCVIGALNFWVTSATGIYAWYVSGFATFAYIAIAINQPTFIEGMWLVGIIFVLVTAAAFTDHLGFQWSIILTAFLGAMTGNGGRESRHRKQFLDACGEAEFRKRYASTDP